MPPCLPPPFLHVAQARTLKPSQMEVQRKIAAENVDVGRVSRARRDGGASRGAGPRTCARRPLQCRRGAACTPV